MQSKGLNIEVGRLAEDERREKNWKRWGPYLAERQWGTVREDYSPDGSCWTYFPHDMARSRAYRWGEDGLLGITDRQCRLCFAVALWNGRDSILKERLFGLTNPEGNHGEDVKECYFYLDSTPTHSYMRALYKYPQAEFPYARLVEENKRRTKNDPEYELTDTGVFDENRYFDVFVEYAKNSPNDILVRITVMNRAADRAMLHLLPTLWFRNTWAWGQTGEGHWPKSRFELIDDQTVAAEHATLGRFRLQAEALSAESGPEFLFTENETNVRKLFGGENSTPYVKDAFHERIVHGQVNATNPEKIGTKTAAYYQLNPAAHGTATVNLRLFAEEEAPEQSFGQSFNQVFEQRMGEANQFYEALTPVGATPEAGRITRRAYAGLLWSKQFYHYAVDQWLEGDPAQPPPPTYRLRRNADWTHLFNRDVVSVPDKWEYPWYAAWDLAFHMVPFAQLDSRFTMDQLVLFLREWYMHPNGQLPAYEFAFGDVNPPMHAWAAWRVYKITKSHGKHDRAFLERVFQKLLINFTWWVNRKDVEGNHIFAGGFLGLDNIGLFDRSQPLPSGTHLDQADGTAWMAFYCATMLAIALELAHQDPVYEDVASKFFEHFIAIVDAINALGGTGLWNEEVGFYCDHITTDGRPTALNIRSMVGIIPLFAVEVLEEDVLERLPGFAKRMRWFLENRQDLAQYISFMEVRGKSAHRHRLLAIPSRERFTRVLGYLLDEHEFLSDYGIRSLSRVYKDDPYILKVGGTEYRVEYMSGESNTALFGGNSNWRGPIWFPVNYLLIEALERYHHFYGETFLVECPTGSGRMMNLGEVAQEITRRLARLFLADESGRSPWQGNERRFSEDPHWQELVCFYEYFDGDTGRGVGASHQTGWTALVARLLEDLGRG